MAPIPSNQPVNNVPALFNSMALASAANGILFTTDGGYTVANIAESHIQGMARYSNSNGSFLLFSHNNKGYSKGYLFAINTATGTTYEYETSLADYNHPSGIQVVGDYLVLPVASSDSQNSYVDFYDLSSAFASQSDGPTCLTNLRITRDGLDSAAAGMTLANGTYYLAVYGTGSVSLYTISQSDFASSVNGWSDAQTVISDPQGWACLNLVTDSSTNVFNQTGAVYLIGFRSEYDASGANYQDYADLIQLVNPSGTLALDAPATTLSVSVEAGSTEGVYGVHFRWAGGLTTSENGGMSLCASARNFIWSSSYSVQWNNIPGWQWLNLNQPVMPDTSTSAVTASTPVGAMTVEDTGNVFVIGSDGNLWTCYSSNIGWEWASLGQPGSATISMAAGAATVDGSGNVFVVGSDGNLWTCFWDGSSWGWASLGQPSSATISTPVATVVIGNSGNVCVVGSDGKLWTCFWNGSSWGWASLGKPSSATISMAAGAATVDGSGNVFVVGSDGNLWTCFWNGSSWGWASLGQPSDSGNTTATLTTPVGATAVGDSGNVFVVDSDGNLWTCFWNGSNWEWANLGQPSILFTIAEPMGAIAIGDNGYAFVMGSDGCIWICSTSGSNGLQWSKANPAPTLPISSNPAYTPILTSSVGLLGSDAFAIDSQGMLWTCYA